MNSNDPIHQLVHTLSYGDAISGEVLALQRACREMGRESEVYAINVHPKLKQQARIYTELSAEFSGRLILHYSLGSPLNDLYRNLNSAHRTLIYHNITPSRWFEGINPRIVQDIERGRRELPELCSVSDSLISDSQFNAGELRALGFDSDVLELPLDPERWNMKSNDGIAALLRGDSCKHIVHVGRFAPNKRIEDIIKAFYFMHHHIDRRSKLWLIGIDIDTEIYSFALKRLVYELSLDDSVNFISTFSDSELKALYENATLYICLSEHEGFCVPLVEAMHFGLPVIAYASSAVPGTLGTGGLLISEKHPARLAELMNIACSDQQLRIRLIEAGRARVGQLSFDKFAEKFREIITRPSGTGAAPLRQAR
ncbi:MAG: glycosyltransferase [Deltaproteobacteria bacterium]|nr:glycosyltransferase [Deltaproteobacteria bacterium]